MITEQDSLQLQKDFKKVFATKTEFKNFQQELAVVLADIRGELKDFRKEINNDLASTKSDLMGELQTIREEQAAGFYRQRENTDQLEDHETRINNLESKISPTSV